MRNYTFDFSAALGDTIMEKYESLWIRIKEVSDVIGKIWMVAGSEEIVSIFETATVGFTPPVFSVMLGNLSYAGTVRANHGVGGNFLVAKTHGKAQDLILFGTEGNATLEFINYV